MATVHQAREGAGPLPGSRAARRDFSVRFGIVTPRGGRTEDHSANLTAGTNVRLHFNEQSAKLSTPQTDWMTDNAVRKGI